MAKVTTSVNRLQLMSTSFRTIRRLRFARKLSLDNYVQIRAHLESREVAILTQGRSCVGRRTIYNPRRLTDVQLMDLIRETRDKIDEVDEALQQLQQELVRRTSGGDG